MVGEGEEPGVGSGKGLDVRHCTAASKLCTTRQQQRNNAEAEAGCGLVLHCPVPTRSLLAVEQLHPIWKE